MEENLDSVYEQIKNNKIGWREERIIEGKKYLVFVRPDGEGTEVVFRELLAEK